jgi:Flp pilus assembly protein TadG
MRTVARRRRRGRPWGDRGTVTTEVLLIGFPVTLIMLAFTLAVIRGGSGHIDVGNAAAAAARAASLQRTPGQAIDAATRTATDDLDVAHSACRDVTVTVDTSNFRPGGTVTVKVACTVSLTDLPMTGLRPNWRVTASSTSPLDLYRQAIP